MTAPPGAPQTVQVPVWKLLVTLGAAGAIAGFLIVFVYAWSQPIIQAYKARDRTASTRSTCTTVRC